MQQTRAGKLLKDAREAAGLTRSALSTRVAVPVPTIEAWEMKPTTGGGPRAIGLFKIARALRIDLDELAAAFLDLPAGYTDTDTPTVAAVRGARLELGVTVQDLATLLGIEPERVVAYESGAEEAPVSVMAAIVRLVTAELSGGHHRD